MTTSEEGLVWRKLVPAANVASLSTRIKAQIQNPHLTIEERINRVESQHDIDTSTQIVDEQLVKSFNQAKEGLGDNRLFFYFCLRIFRRHRSRLARLLQVQSRQKGFPVHFVSSFLQVLDRDNQVHIQPTIGKESEFCSVQCSSISKAEEVDQDSMPNMKDKRRDWEPDRGTLVTEAGLKTVIFTTQALFISRSTYPESTFEKAIATTKKLVRWSQRLTNFEERTWIAENSEIWKEYVECLESALPVLESQSLALEDPNTSSASLIATNYVTLLKDLERLDDLVQIARNILATTTKAQNIAGDSGMQQQVIKVIDVCVRVTARGYDGEAGARINEVQWTNIMSAYKNLLVTCLQFLHNAVQQNEKRKLLLWLDLFASSRSADQYLPENGGPRTSTLFNPDTNAVETISDTISTDPVKERNFAGDLLLSSAIQHVQEAKKAVDEAGEVPEAEAARITSQVMDTVEGMVSMTLEQGRQNAAPFYDPATAPVADQYWSDISNSTLHSDPRGTGAIRPEDMKCVRTPESAAITLQAAKDQLMARLQDPPTGLEEDGEQRPFSTSGNAEDIASDVGADGSAVDDNNEDEDDYRNSDQERGILTDIPLVLDPKEIEALPMILSAGIVGKATDAKDKQDMQSVRCNILLAQETGRNLLRELLIFIAAWDLQDDDLYFKLMMQIMEAILANGLMPFAYQAFGEVKDIVSPAQSMVIKILTQIFRGKQGLPPMSLKGSTSTTVAQRREPPTRVDLLIIRYIFTIFRQCIIPETCALIYLQGQIRAENALPEDFPLNLWDMERVYEGVYQFLEFFAVLTESEDWKGLLVSWEIVSELVTLLRELEASIPKAPLDSTPTAATATGDLASLASAMQERNPPEHTASSQASAPTPVAVERPYDSLPIDDPLGTNTANPTVPPTGTYPSNPASPSPSQAIDSQEPSDFEWRNLKKLVVLVLSSLVWKSPVVQNQIRTYGGVEMILACCNFDANNPYIREHAIMCLRFLLEGNKENQAIVRGLEPKNNIEERGAALTEEVAKRGFEAFVDEAGKQGLRTKDGGQIII